MDAKNIRILAILFSFACNAGFTNLNISQIIYGEASTNPAYNENFICERNWSVSFNTLKFSNLDRCLNCIFPVPINSEKSDKNL